MPRRRRPQLGILYIPQIQAAFHPTFRLLRTRVTSSTAQAPLAAGSKPVVSGGVQVNSKASNSS